MVKIIVGVDASDRPLDAVAFARELAEVVGAGLMLASAYPYASTASRVPVPALREAMRSDAVAALARTGELLEGFDAVETVTIADTSPARALQVLAEEEDAALTVVGSSHRGAAGRVLIGSTAMRLLHGSPSAVAVVPQGYRDRPDRSMLRIGVGYDESDESRTAVAAAAVMARALGAQLRVIGVLNLEVEKATAMTPPGYIHSLEDVERSVRQDLDEVVAALPSDVKAEAVLREGAPADVLAEESQELDLLFTGSRAYGPLRAVLLGSVTQRLLQHAACPVIVLPRGADEPAFERLVAQTLEGQTS
jgi:nucleotide-binding universal stress UspA family protein